MENYLFSIWKQISKKDKVVIAVDGSTYDYDDQELAILSDLKIFKQFEILYATNREIENIENKDLSLKIHIPKIMRAGGKDEYETRLYELGSENLRGSGFRGEKLLETLSTELIACLSIADFTVTKTKTSEIPYYTNNIHSFYGKNPFSGTLSECMSALRVWINKLDDLDLGNGKIGFSKWMSTSLAINILLPHFHKAWGAAIVSKEEEYPLGDGSVKEYLSSISLRSKHLITTRDMLELLKFNSFDRFNTKQDRYSYLLIYYFGYFLLLLTGIFDALDTISYWRIKNENKKPIHISFRKKNRDSQIYRREISSMNKDFGDFIGSEKIQSTLRFIYFFRNYIAHDIMPGGITYLGNYQGLSGDLLLLKGKLIENMKDFAEHNELITKEQLLDVGIDTKPAAVGDKEEEKLFEPILFSRYMVSQAMSIVDSTFRLLKVEQKLLSSQKEIEEFEKLINRVSRTAKNDIFEKVDRALSYVEASVP